MMTKAFVLYPNQWRGLKELTEPELGRLTASIFRVLNGEDEKDVEVNMSEKVLVAFRFLMLQIDIDTAKYLDKKRKNLERQERYKKQNQGNAHKVEVEKEVEVEGEVEEEKEDEVEVEVEKEDDGSKAVYNKAAAAAESSFFTEAKEKWLPWFNKLLSDYDSKIPKVKVMTTKRVARLQEIINTYGAPALSEVCRRAAGSQFLNGKGTKNKFVATLDWILDEKNFLKIYEGNYNI